MPDYSKGKIYMVCSNNPEQTDCYFGSTTQPLCDRMSGHRSGFKNKKQVTSCKIFEKYGVENCHIELLKLFPCGSREELEAEEHKFTRSMECVNKQGRGAWTNLREWGQQYREKNKEQRKQYHEKHKEQIEEYKQQWYQENKEQIIEKSKQHNEKNKEAISLKRKEKITCGCGCIVSKGNLPRHCKSKVHLDFINNLSI